MKEKKSKSPNVLKNMQMASKCFDYDIDILSQVTWHGERLNIIPPLQNRLDTTHRCFWRVYNLMGLMTNYNRFPYYNPPSP